MGQGGENLGHLPRVFLGPALLSVVFLWWVGCFVWLSLFALHDCLFGWWVDRSVGRLISWRN